MPRRHGPVSGHGRAAGTSAGNVTGTGVGHGAPGASTPTAVGAAAGTGVLRGLVGAGPSQVGIVGALRARDVSQPTPDDLARALEKPEPTARPAIRQDAAAQDATAQETAESGSGGGTSVSS